MADYTIPEVLRRHAPAMTRCCWWAAIAWSPAPSPTRSVIGCEVLRACLQGEPSGRIASS
jgi:hypothetical protein